MVQQLQGSVGIIGGAGKMGKWCARFLAGEGKKVIISDCDTTRLARAAEELGVETATGSETAKRSDVLIMAVPPDAFEQAVKDISVSVRDRQVVIDISSIKGSSVSQMHQYLPAARVLGVHPMFGPSAPGISGQNFVLTPTNEVERKLAGEVKAFLETRGASVVFLMPEEHDRMMALVLGLCHFIGLVSADILAQFGKPAEAGAVGGPSYRTLLSLAHSVVSEDPELYASIQMSLPGLPEIEKQFVKTAAAWAEIVGAGKKREFVRRMAGLKSTFAAIRNNPPGGSL